jgi:hypothetical protein
LFSIYRRLEARKARLWLRPLHSPRATFAGAGFSSAAPDFDFQSPIANFQSKTGADKSKFGNRKSKILLVRNHPLDLGRVRIADQNGLAQFLFPLVRLGSENVAQERFPPQYLPFRRLLEALGSAFVCF